jgi:hypothetical protein
LSVSASLRRDRAEAESEGGEIGDTAGLETCATRNKCLNAPLANDLTFLDFFLFPF